MARPPRKKHVTWYQDVRSKYETLSSNIRTTIEQLLRTNKVEFLAITARAKTVESFSEKLSRKGYRDPQEEMTDLAGIRVVTFVERDINRTADLIRTSFNVRQDDSVDKALTLGSDRVGYRSLHLVCDIGSARAALSEFAPYRDMLFEIQIRTVLQHAWAEIEHDRSYKFSGELPSQMKRRFHLVAGLLELADREFTALTEDIERYETEVRENTAAGDLETELNSASLNAFLTQMFSQLPPNAPRPVIEPRTVTEEEVAELKAFGIHKLSELAPRLTPELFALLAKHGVDSNTFGFLRDVMILSDPERYFSDAWQKRWHGWDASSVAAAGERLGKTRIAKLIEKYEIDIIS